MGPVALDNCSPDLTISQNKEMPDFAGMWSPVFYACTDIAILLTKDICLYRIDTINFT